MNSGSTLKNRRRVRCGAVSKTGFTLVELVAALVIGSTLLVATLSMLRTATRYNKLARTDVQLQPALGLLSEQLQRDFINGRAIRSGLNSVAIAGFMGQASAQSALEPAVIVYEIGVGGEQHVLFRSETQPLATNRRSQRRPMIVGAVSLNVIVHAESETDDDVTAAAFGTGMRPMPDHLQIIIGGKDGRILFVKDILHQSGLD